MEDSKDQNCGNCKLSGEKFLVIELPHVHCADPDQFTQEQFEKGEFTAWDSLRDVNDDCSSHVPEK